MVADLFKKLSPDSRFEDAHNIESVYIFGGCQQYLQRKGKIVESRLLYDIFEEEKFVQLRKVGNQFYEK